MDRRRVAEAGSRQVIVKIIGKMEMLDLVA
jgi:hypothetical protein